jgi:hypothetical protein
MKNEYIEYVEADPWSTIEDQMSRVAYHEAGHFVTAELLGFKMQNAWIASPSQFAMQESEVTLGMVFATWPNSQSSVIADLTDPEELRAQALFSIGGSVGIILIGEHSLDSVYADTSSPDMDDLHICIHNLMPQASEFEKRAAVDDFAFEAFKLLQPHKDRIREVATELYVNAGQTPPNLFPEPART